VSVAEIIDGMSDEVERLTGQAGLLIMKAVMDAEIESVAGPKGRHDPDRSATRWTAQQGYVVLAGKKVKVTKPRLRDMEGHEVALRSYERFQSPLRRQSSICKKLIAGLSTRKYEQAIDDFTDGYGISKSVVRRDLVSAARGSLQALCERRLEPIAPLAALRIDGTPIHGECVAVALGVDLRGDKHILGLTRGATEHSTVERRLLDDRIGRGLNTSQPMLIILDGSKALRKAVPRMFAEASPVWRCPLHKRRNLTDLLPEGYRSGTGKRIRTASAINDFAPADTRLQQQLEWLEGINPSAAGSLREGLEETLTLHRLKVPDALRKSFQSTNLIESALSVADDVAGRAKHWRSGDMRLRWTAAGLLAAEQQFRRVRGHKLMPELIVALHEGARGAQGGKKEIAGESRAA